MNHAAIEHFAVALGAVFAFFCWGIFLWPMLGAALWLGEASLCPVEGKYPSRFWQSVGEIALLVTVCIAVTMLLKVLFDWDVQALWFPKNTHRPAGELAFAILVVLLYFVFAVLEELFYRGILLRCLIWKASDWRYRLEFSLLCSAAIFCLGHGPVITLSQFVQKMVLGVGLGWLSLRRGLWASIVAHCAFNLIINCLI
jgi:membrane protease YdiL (CAAX protease family)